MNYLLLRVGQWDCALRAQDVCEVMRPLPLWGTGKLPKGVLGLSRIRGVAVPVLQLSDLLGVEALSRYWVTTRTPTVACAVEEVLGLRALPEEIGLPALSANAFPGLRGLAARDGGLCCILETARLIDRETYDSLVASENSADA